MTCQRSAGVPLSQGSYTFSQFSHSTIQFSFNPPNCPAFSNAYLHHGLDTSTAICRMFFLFCYLEHAGITNQTIILNKGKNTG